MDMLKGVALETMGAYPSVEELTLVLKALIAEGIPIYSITYRSHDMKKELMLEVRIETYREEEEMEEEEEEVLEGKEVH